MIRCATRYGAGPGRLHRPPRTFALSAAFGLAYIKALLAPGSAPGGLPRRGRTVPALAILLAWQANSVVTGQVRD